MKVDFVSEPLSEKDSLLLTVNKLQQTLQEQCNLRGISNNISNTHTHIYSKKRYPLSALTFYISGHNNIIVLSRSSNEV